MVRWIFSAPKFFQVRAARGVDHGRKEFFRSNMGRAGGRNENPVAGKPGQGGFDEFAVRAKRARFFGVAFGEAWRGKNDYAEAARWFGGEKLEGVGLDCFMPRFFKVVEGKVAAGAGESVGADVEVSDGRRSAARGINREAAGKAKGVQNVAIARECCDDFSVFPLIKKEAGFLAA